MNDAHETILQKYFWDFVDRGDATANTPLFTGIHGEIARKEVAL